MVHCQERAPRNRTITLTDVERTLFLPKLKRIHGPVSAQDIENCTINQDLFQIIDYLPKAFVDLLFIDPPYNLTKSFNGRAFKRMPTREYADWIDSWLSRLVKILKPSASIYICGDWSSSAAIHEAAERYFKLQNRITWEREKGRGQMRGWKNCSEDIFFCTMSDQYVFNTESVKLKRRVIAPYTHPDGKPKDWECSEIGNFRITYPSNLWTDITVPYWSMPENTDHPTQKPEKLLAKIILASSNEGNMVFDPFSGSGTTSVVAKKLQRKYVGVEIDETYCCIAEKRLEMADHDTRIQGYEDGVFWDRNSLGFQKRNKRPLAVQRRLLA
ncbi:MAG: site-specific DNA-methyltransferase [Chloroflexi bacterium]|nr:site-specific DNA-methyltransferase [Chloroflexota bacterium]MBM4451776.1 site-specific DNA-methyltransferase [Chloroflexota bacterium]